MLARPILCLRVDQLLTASVHVEANVLCEVPAVEFHSNDLVGSFRDPTSSLCRWRVYIRLNRPSAYDYQNLDAILVCHAIPLKLGTLAVMSICTLSDSSEPHQWHKRHMSCKACWQMILGGPDPHF